MGEFGGFGSEALEFLAELANNNHKAWFDENKQRYEDTIREPARAFVRDMGKKLGKLSKEFVADDRKVGGSLMRIYRDVRFSKDKTPYKTNVGIHFRHRQGKDVHAPGAYVHLGLDGVFLGMGMWRPDSPSLLKIREAIAEDPKRWKRVRDGKKLNTHWRYGGDSLKRPPKGFDKEHPMIDDLKRKDHILVADMTLEEAESKDLVDFCIKRFSAAKPHTAFLCDAIGVPF